MKENYFTTMELDDATIFNAFNSDQKWFTEHVYHHDGGRIDVTAKDTKGRKAHVEIKQRTGKYGVFMDFIKRFKDIYLDTGKLEVLSKIMASGYTLQEQELFMSIFDKGNTILVHNLNKPMTIEWLPNQRLFNPGTKQWEFEHRIGLKWWDAMVFTKEEDGHYRQWTDEEKENLMIELYAD